MILEYLGRARNGLGRWLREDGVVRSICNHLAPLRPASALERRELLIFCCMIFLSCVAGMHVTRLRTQRTADFGCTVADVRASHHPNEQLAAQQQANGSAGLPVNCSLAVKADGSCSLDCCDVDAKTYQLLTSYRLRVTFTKNLLTFTADGGVEQADIDLMLGSIGFYVTPYIAEPKWVTELLLTLQGSSIVCQFHVLYQRARAGGFPYIGKTLLLILLGLVCIAADCCVVVVVSLVVACQFIWQFVGRNAHALPF